MHRDRKIRTVVLFNHVFHVLVVTRMLWTRHQVPETGKDVSNEPQRYERSQHVYRQDAKLHNSSRRTVHGGVYWPMKAETT